VSKILSIISCFFAVAVAVCVIYSSQGGYNLVWNRSTMSYSKFQTLIRTESNSIEDVLWRNEKPIIEVTLKNQSKQYIYLSSDQKIELLNELLKREVPVKVNTCQGGSIAPSLDWLSEVLLRFSPGDGSNKNHAN
jgi:ATP-dependent Zn protease